MKKYLLLLLLATPLYAASPVIFYTDLPSGCKTGGLNNKGSWVTLFGKNFGYPQGASSISIGGGAPDNYAVWSDSFIVAQLGSSAATGNITVTNSTGTSNGVSFSTRTCDIYFISTTGNDDTGAGTYASPWRHISKLRDTFDGGDIGYLRGGTYTTSGEGSDGDFLYVSPSRTFGGNASVGNPHCFVGVPYETVILQAGTDGEDVINWCSGNADTVMCSNIVFANFIFDANNTKSGVQWRGCVNGANTTYRPKHIRYVNLEVKNWLGSSGGGAGFIECGADGPLDDVVRYGLYVHDMDTGDSLDHLCYESAGGDGYDIGWCRFEGIYRINASAGYPGYCFQIYHGESSNYADFTNVKIHDNIFKDDRGRGGLNIAEAVVSFQVYNNLISSITCNSSYAGNHLRLQCASTNGTGYVYNNTIYQGGATYADSLMDLSESGNTYYLKNNIFSSISGLPYYVQEEATPATIHSSSNCWYGNGALPDIAQAGELNVDPKLVAPATFDFHLQSISPCIDKGIDTSATVLRDYDGLLNTAPCTIGAYRYTAGAGEEETPAAETYRSRIMGKFKFTGNTRVR